MEVWRAFEHNVITHSAAHHIMTIARLIEKNGYARATDVAKSLGISRSSASITLKSLKEKGYVEEDENKFLVLSAAGAKLSQSIRSKRLLLIKFLHEVLQMDSEQAEIDACKMEHLVSKEAGEKLLLLMKFVSSGDPKAVAFVKALQASEDSCKGAVEECEFCETTCILDEEL